MGNTRYISTKIFDNFSCAIRQHKAAHSHCSKIHGYSFEVKVWFSSVYDDLERQLDDMNWVVDFGGFKTKPVGNGLKDWLNDLLDHTFIVEKDDPYLPLFEDMQMSGIAKLVVMDKMGAESLAKFIFDKFNEVLSNTNEGRCKVIRVEVFENKKNSAIYEEI